MLINLHRTILDTSTPLIMGILNITPDSFYDGGKYNNEKLLLLQAEKHIEQGCDLLDIGAYSSRPQADNISNEIELNRLLPALTSLRNTFPDMPFSIDTFRSEIVEKAYNTIGPFIINDISGGSLDSGMFSIAAKYKLPYILMHMRGTPQTMQQQTVYTNVISDIIKDLQIKIRLLEKEGCNDIIVDPGIGFSKTVDQNFSILKHLNAFKILDKPILAGLSRKSLLSKTLGVETPQTLNGTSILHTIALQNGASILRVHDVLEAKECITLHNKIKEVY